MDAQNPRAGRRVRWSESPEAERFFRAVAFLEVPRKGSGWLIFPAAAALLKKYDMQIADFARMARTVCADWEDPKGRLPVVPWSRKAETTTLIARLAGRVEGHFQILLEEADTSGMSQMLAARHGLTAREAEVLAWIAQGKTNSAIASILGCKTRTIDKHTERVLAKLGVETRTAAAAVLLSATTCAAKRSE
jgi:DNA-binding CsgD family transcriptional regulator